MINDSLNIFIVNVHNFNINVLKHYTVILL